MKRCPRCLHQNKDSSLFCTECGLRLNDAQTEKDVGIVYSRAKNYLFHKTVFLSEKVNFFLNKIKNNGCSRKEKLFIIALAAVLIFYIGPKTINYLSYLSNNLFNQTFNAESVLAKDTIIKCNVCGGDGSTCTHCYAGECPKCSGSGDIFKIDGYKNGFPVSRRYRCEACDGTGKCSVCNGYAPCDSCRGTGHTLVYTGQDYCLACKGDGICTTCRGDGEYQNEKCPNHCNSGYCPQCNGTGREP